MTRVPTLRGRLTALSLLVALVAVAALTVAFNVVLVRSLDGDAKGRARTQAAAAATTVSFDHGRLHVRESPDDAAVDRQIWIYAGRRAIERPPAGPGLQRAADAMAGRTRVFAEAPGDVRLYAAPITARGRRVGTVVAGVSLAAYERTSDVAVIGSLALAGVLLAAVGVITWLTIGRALHPVREMTRSAADWSEHDPGRRFGATPRPDELGELARTFDALLDRVAASLRHEQRLSAELSHELRTPLSRIVAEVELLQRRERSAADRREAYAGIGRSAEQMSSILETLMTAARAEARLDQGRADVGDTLAGLAEHWRPLLGERDLSLDVDPGVVAGVDPEVVERIVTPLLDNAARYARSRVTLSAARADSRVVLSVADDGPGVPDAARERVFEPGARLNGDAGHGGAGLGLALARRLARAAGGDVTAVAPRTGAGAELRVELPG